MASWHGELGKKRTGGKIIAHRKKRKYELGSEAMLTKIGKTVRRITRTKGGRFKIKAASVEFANVYDPASKTMKKVKIVSVKENPANPHYVRRNIVTKGAIIETEAGLARITSKPSQHGVVNAVIVEGKSKSE